MERSTKKYKEEFLSLAQHLHITIKRRLEAGNREQAMGLLEQCQSYAIALGQQIESAGETDTDTVALLEDYCELVYQIYEKLHCLLPLNPNDVHNALALQLIRISNRIKKE